MVIESVTDLRWADVVEERIRGKMGARMPLFANLAPDGTALIKKMVSEKSQATRFSALFKKAL